VGTIGKRETFDVILDFVTGYETQYGYTTVLKFRTVEGATIVWKASNTDVDRSDVGKSYKLTGTVKSHDDYKGQKQTMVTRSKLVPREPLIIANPTPGPSTWAWVLGGIAVVGLGYALFSSRKSATFSYVGVGDVGELGPSMTKLAFDNGSALNVDVFTTPEQIRTGLMNIWSMPDDQGAVFVFNGQGPKRFWMRSTRIPLDMLAVDESGMVIAVVENAQPMTDTPIELPENAMYVVEVNAGWARSHGIQPGSMVNVDSIIPVGSGGRALAMGI
jgi:uncharacterized membrane protein (UPF0127 family)